jgi:predicted anti-sigma-YlaC factor YlaD
MSCDAWQNAISAIVDGEPTEIDPQLVDAHVRGCAACASFRDAAHLMRRHGALQPAPEVPDHSRRIVKAHAVADRRSGWGIARLLLAAIAMQILVLASPALVLGEDAHSSAHEARHLGAFTAAYGVALLVAAIRPSRARTIFPVACFVAAALAITAVVDIASGDAPVLQEALHIPEILGVVLVWLLTIPAPRRRFRRATPPLERPDLRVVEPDTQHRAG